MAVQTKIRSAFGDILREQLGDTTSIKELARRLAGEGATREQVEGRRRLIQKYIAGTVTPPKKSRDEIARVLEIDPALFAEDAERAREMQEIADAMVPLVDVLHRLAVQARMKASA